MALVCLDPLTATKPLEFAYSIVRSSNIGSLSEIHPGRRSGVAASWKWGRHLPRLTYWQGPDELIRFADGWYDTGDVVIEDEDCGYEFVSRKKELIVRSGSNIFPVEVG
jgi:acyl-coenzyme A synthetase/AMP-(fatty) acid ligase